MSTFINQSGHPLDIPALDLHVEDGETFTVSDDAAEGLRSQSIYLEVDAPKPAAPTRVADPAPALPIESTSVAPVDQNKGE